MGGLGAATDVLLTDRTTQRTAVATPTASPPACGSARVILMLPRTPTVKILPYVQAVADADDGSDSIVPVT